MSKLKPLHADLMPCMILPAVEGLQNTTRGELFHPRVIRIYRSKHFGKQWITLRYLMVTPQCRWWRCKAKKQKEASLGGAKGRATRFPSRENVDEYWQSRLPRAAYSGVWRTRREQSGQEVACETQLCPHPTDFWSRKYRREAGHCPIPLQRWETWAPFELHLSAKPRRPAPPSLGIKGQCPLPPRNAWFLRLPTASFAVLLTKSVPTWSHASTLVEGRVPWLQSWNTRFDGENGSLTGPLARCLFTALRIMELAKIMLPRERRIDTCKGQAAALFVSFRPSHLNIFPPPSIPQSSRTNRDLPFARCLSQRTLRRTIGSLRSPPSHSSLHQLVTVPTMLPTVTPLRWLPGPSPCPKLVCLRCAQSSLELSR